VAVERVRLGKQAVTEHETVGFTSGASRGRPRLCSGGRQPFGQLSSVSRRSWPGLPSSMTASPGRSLPLVRSPATSDSRSIERGMPALW
jgi:hypothetical protein